MKRGVLKVVAGVLVMGALLVPINTQAASKYYCPDGNSACISRGYCISSCSGYKKCYNNSRNHRHGHGNCQYSSGCHSSRSHHSSRHH